MTTRPPADGALPEGLVYTPGFLSPDEETDLLTALRALEFDAIEMHGVVARRRALHYGWSYSYDSHRLAPGPPLPPFLAALRERVAGWITLPPESLAEALVQEYPPGATIGWHRDAPMFGRVVGVSLLGSCRMRFRRGEGSERRQAELTLEPRSAYLLDGPVRTRWQHGIPATKELRCSITFRTLRRRPE